MTVQDFENAKIMFDKLKTLKDIKTDLENGYVASLITYNGLDSRNIRHVYPFVNNELKKVLNLHFTSEIKRLEEEIDKL